MPLLNLLSSASLVEVIKSTCKCCMHFDIHLFGTPSQLSGRVE
jgi:hypothetical protein